MKNALSAGVFWVFPFIGCVCFAQGFPAGNNSGVNQAGPSANYSGVIASQSGGTASSAGSAASGAGSSANTFVNKTMMTAANAGMKQCLESPILTGNDAYKDTDYDCAESAVPSNPSQWSGVLYQGKTTNQINGLYGVNGTKCADGSAPSAKCPFAITVAYKYACGSLNTTVKNGVTYCPAADRVSTLWAFRQVADIPNMPRMPDSIVGEDKAVPVSIRQINALKYAEYKCPANVPLVLGMSNYGQPICGEDPKKKAVYVENCGFSGPGGKGDCTWVKEK